ncbi:Ubiquitin--protein ligase [Bertholletia excelsa]
MLGKQGHYGNFNSSHLLFKFQKTQELWTDRTTETREEEQRRRGRERNGILDTEKNMGEVIMFVGDLKSISAAPSCRICHEGEFESCKSLEAPCACSGTVKFAHRDCIQRWCDEKGNTTCEICLQKFEPGYTAPLKVSQRVDATVDVRGSLEVPIRETEEEEEEEEMLETEYSECTAATDRGVNCCRAVALVFTVLLLVRHILAVLAGGAEVYYPFSLTTILLIKASGIVLPMYIILRIITAVQSTIIKRQDQVSDASTSILDGGDVENDHRRIIHS